MNLGFPVKTSPGQNVPRLKRPQLKSKRSQLKSKDQKSEASAVELPP
jgi:hypothetical protein